MTSGNTNLPPVDPHRPADDREEVYFEGSPLLRGELGQLALWAIVAVVLVAAGAFSFTVIGFFGLIPILLGLACLVIPWLLTRSVRYRISNYRIDYERGLLSRRIDTLELWHVDDISFHQSLPNRLLNVGTIRVVSHDDSTPNLDLRAVPNPRQLFDQLKQRIISVKRQRGVIKMDVG